MAGDHGRQAGERPVVFDCDGDVLVGIVHPASETTSIGVVIVVGGPQYRVGSHRQFVLLARRLAAAGIAALRFDYRGMGDSGGEPRTFEGIDRDIQCAIDTLLEHQPQIRRIVLWGLCDAASAILMYAYRDPRVGAAILCNPWVHTEQAEAQVRLKRYYLQRLTSRDFWQKARRGGLDLGDSWRSLVRYCREARSTRPGAAGGAGRDYVERMREGLEWMRVPVFVILSGNDITADEFRALAARAPWSVLCRSQVSEVATLEAANHTFARAEWRDAVADHTINWIRSLA